MKQFLLVFLLTFVSYIPSHAQTVEELQQELREAEEVSAQSIFDLLTEPERMEGMRNLVFLAAAGEDVGIDPAGGLAVLRRAHIMLALMFEHLAIVEGRDFGERSIVSSGIVSPATIEKALELATACIGSNYLECAPPR